MRHSLAFCLSFISLLGCTTKSPQATAQVAQKSVESADPYLWLEEVDSKRAIDKVEAWNKVSLSELQGDSRYSKIEGDVRQILLADDRIPMGYFGGGFVFNFWQDKKSVRGIWRRTTLSEYQKKNPRWEILLDLDALAKKENENWVWKGSQCLEPKLEKCVVKLSRGGKDAVVLREFDTKTKDFVDKGFFVPEAKSDFAWIDENTVFIGTNFGPGSLTTSGYPRQVRLWKRGEDLEKAALIFEGSVDDVSSGGWVNITPERTWKMISRAKTFYKSEYFLYRDDGTLERLPTPEDFDVEAIHGNWLIGTARTDWSSSGRVFRSGTLIAFRLDDLAKAPVVVRKPQERTSVSQMASTQAGLFMILSKNVRGHVMRVKVPADPGDQDWELEPVAFPNDGELSISSSNRFNDTLFISHSSFISPNSVWLLRPARSGGKMSSFKIRSLPAKFDASNLKVDQFETKSRDGVTVPYFVIRPKNMKFDGQTPTLLYGYGGFNLPMNPWYLGAVGKVWSEKNRVYVLANIRGGGEFGPSWHEAARLKNKQKSYDDFIAIAEDLIKRGITSPRRLGIMGGSNGGLLVGAAFTQRPELFNAVVCQVPLLDMLRYHKLLAGASWMAEYGDPDDAEMRAVILGYSPYQKLDRATRYPRVMFTTSTRDDRVHPGHARKMAARMEELGLPFVYYENTEGGHAGAANLEQRVKMTSQNWMYLTRQLVD